MINKKQNRLFSFLLRVFYKDISLKFRADSFKNLMDLLYIIFEKIAKNFEFLSQNYINMYEELVEKEVKSSYINEDDSVLVIGCGSIPSTSILISKFSKAKKIVSIDYDSNAIKNAKYFMKSKNYGKNITFEHGDGLKYPVQSFDVIFILYGIKKQQEIIEYISKNMKDISIIIFRTTTDSFEKILGGKDFLEKYFKIEKSIFSDNLPNTISFVLKKK